MRKILFVCHGNICRSPMAEFILKDRIKKYNLDIYTESRAVSSEEYMNDIYPPAKRVLDKHNIKYDRHYAKRISFQDYDDYDEIYVMDNSNMYYITRMIDDKDNKIKLLNGEIEDPWYTDNFESVFKQIEEGIDKLIKVK